MQFFYNPTQFCEFLQNPSTQQNHKLVVCWVLSYVTVVLPVSTRIWPGMFIMIRHFLFLRPTSIPNFFIHDETSWSPGSWSYGLMILGSWSHDPPGYGTWSPGHGSWSHSPLSYTSNDPHNGSSFCCLQRVLSALVSRLTMVYFRQEN